MVADMDNKRFVLQRLIGTLEKHGVKNRVPEASIFWPEHWGIHEVFESMGYICAREFNVFKVDLGKPLDQLLKSIAHNKRRNIKKAQVKGVEVIESTTNEDLISFYEMLEISGGRAGFTPPSFNRFKAFLKVFGPRRKVRIFLADWRGQHVAGVFVVVHGDTAYALGAGSREEAWSVRPNDLLHWTAMELCCEEGLSNYHMGHVSEPVPTEGSSLWGLWRWKREWNGKLERILTYHKVYLPKVKKFLTTPYEIFYKIKQKMSL